MSSSPSSDPLTLARIRDLRLRSEMVGDSLIPGIHRHPRPGFSVEFAHHREYSPGDDPRHVDWKASARGDRLLVKRYQDESTLVAWLLVDASGSMTFRGEQATRSKFEAACEWAAALAWIVVRQRDAVGLWVASEEGDLVLPPSDEPSRWHQVAESLVRFAGARSGRPASERVWRDSVERFLRRADRRGVVIAISDWFDAASEFGGWIRTLRGERGCDLRLLQVLDPDEVDLPAGGETRFEALEGAWRLEAPRSELREAYREQVQRELDAWRVACASQGVLYRMALSTEDAVVVLRDVLHTP